MKQLYSAKSGLEAHELRLFLESQGIAAKVIGDNPVLESIGAFTPASAPAVYVDEADVERAADLLEQFFDGAMERPSAGTWKCASCGEKIESQFDACWNCEAPREDAAIESVALPQPSGEQTIAHAEETRHRRDDSIDDSAVQFLQPRQLTNTREAVLEIIVVLILSWLPGFVQSIVELVWYYQPSSRPYLPRAIMSVTSDLSSIVPVLYIMYRSGEPWRSFGIRRPRPLIDIGLALLIYGMHRAAVSLGHEFLYSIKDTQQAGLTSPPIHRAIGPSGLFERIVDVAKYFVAALSEELISRGYLVCRLKQVLGSTWQSILLSAAVFGLGHLYQGGERMVLTFISGILYACAFYMTGRLWPGVLAHALYNIVLSLCI